MLFRITKNNSISFVYLKEPELQALRAYQEELEITGIDPVIKPVKEIIKDFKGNINTLTDLNLDKIVRCSVLNRSPEDFLFTIESEKDKVEIGCRSDQGCLEFTLTADSEPDVKYLDPEDNSLFQDLRTRLFE